MKNLYKIEAGPGNEPTTIKIILGKKNYSEPKLYIPTEKVNGKERPTVKPGKRWYIWFLWLNPKTDNYDIKIKFSRGLNRLKTVQERKAAGKSLKEAISLGLSRGWIPPSVRNSTNTKPTRKESKTLLDALNYAFEIKSREIKEATADDYKIRMNFFIEWATQKGLIGLPVEKININHIYDYLDYLQLEYKKPNGEGLSNTSIDNYKRGISAMFTVLQHKRLIEHNFINDIPKLKSQPLKNKPFTNSELKDVIAKTKERDPYLVNVIALIIYPLLRPREIVRLKVEDINTEEWILGVETKTERIGYSRIIDKLKPFIKNMKPHNYPGHYHLITNLNEPAVWEPRKLSSKVVHFSRRFKKIIRDLGFEENYSLYSCRHTAILDLYNNLQKEGKSEQQIIFDLMPITGHKSEAGLKNYLRDIRAFIPPDHSNIYTINF